MLDDAHGHDLLAVVTAVHHQGVGETFDNWTLRFAETLHLVAASRMWQIFCVFLFHCYVILHISEIVIVIKMLIIISTTILSAVIVAEPLRAVLLGKTSGQFYPVLSWVIA